MSKTLHFHSALSSADESSWPCDMGSYNPYFGKLRQTASKLHSESVAEHKLKIRSPARAVCPQQDCALCVCSDKRLFYCNKGLWNGLSVKENGTMNILSMPLWPLPFPSTLSTPSLFRDPHSFPSASKQLPLLRLSHPSRETRRKFSNNYVVIFVP